MKMKVFFNAGLFVCASLFFMNANAKVWRVNNNPGVSRDFAEVATAITNASVQNGDTLYVEGSAAAYNFVTLTKRLVFIGSGYFLTENAGLQANTNESLISTIVLDSLASGSTLIGIRVSSFAVSSNVDNITLSRCYAGNFNPGTAFANSRLSGWNVNKCYVNTFNFNTFNFVFENLQLANNFFLSSFGTFSSLNGLIRNNIFMNSVSTSNSYVTNNIFLNGIPLTFTNCTLKNNIAQTNVLPAGNGNQNNVSQASLFTLTGSTDGRYQLKAGSPAIGAGETVNGITPDCGPFGTPDPYRLSGIPPIPTIYALSVPVSVPASATSMTITVSTRSNN
jgi:hypothetical protein